ncbi:hypothetical protein BKA67DRAFT_587237 [Truncatella angustata]|uniref:Uncharacterized protein n=1 Tax=Truncatella angustata TaxID=152316 RepID=A0A9P8RLA8_9PEZI|nr:uncharacterized protein BKA67DRAFT_587237 [Truncatella angustata]KAH6645236.1 hypothetical protein BKA67DRAFT_587237 [Truncatella angustata]
MSSIIDGDDERGGCNEGEQICDVCKAGAETSSFGSARSRMDASVRDGSEQEELKVGLLRAV